MSRLELLPPSEGFLGLEEGDSGPSGQAKAVVVPFGLEASVSYSGGTAGGPAAILKASHQVELFDEWLWREPVADYGVDTLAPFEIETPLEAALAQIAGVCGQILDEGRFPLVLGGEHSLTAGAIRPFVERFGRLSVLHFDAHADLRDGYEGERYSHAAAIRRVLDHDGVRVVSVGIRNISAEEAAWLDLAPRPVRIHWAHERSALDPAVIARELGDDPVYVTFDVDGLDSSLMPATGTPEPGGLFWDDVLPILREVGRSCRIVGADVVELAPIDGFPACDFLVAKLAYRLLTIALSGPTRVGRSRPPAPGRG